MQRSVGIDVLSDGEYRRGGWSEAWGRTIEGLVPYEGPAFGIANVWRGGEFQTQERQQARPGDMTPPGRLVVGEKVRASRRLTGHESGFLAKHAGGPYKVTMPGITMFATGAYRPGISDRVYTTRWDMVLDLVQIMRAEIRALIDEGVPYIQLDSLRYVLPLADPELRRDLEIQGEDPDALLDEAIASDNACLEGFHRDGVTFALHMCRGNMRSGWAAAGAYDIIAEKAFSQLNVDRFLLEYDDERSGGFEPLRFIPRGKQVVLGIVSSKVPELESVDYLLRRVDEASKYVPLEDLAISPQCGFASMSPGNLLTWDEQRRKLELVVQTARKVWG
jgi:5-methyltetrahydropteroyltriglutamate--homocysteine methyltransferase